MDIKLLQSLPKKFPLDYAVVVEKTDVAVAKSTLSDYTSLLRKLDKFDEPVLMYNTGKIASIIKPAGDFVVNPSIEEWHISLVSYEGNLNRPMFLTVTSENRANFRESVQKAAAVAQDIFSRLMQGSLDKPSFYEVKDQFEKTEKVSIQKTKIMSWLDEGHSEGVFQSEIFYSEDDEEYEKHPFSADSFDVVNPIQRINVTVSDGWQSLFYEEIAAILETIKSCLNCGKTLPDGAYKGLYCPNLPENRECYQSRQSQRQRKSRTKT